jgi:Na+/glutamate symporter
MEGAAWAPKFETYRFHGAMQVGLVRAVATLGASGFPAEGVFSDDLQTRGSAQTDRCADGTKREPGQKKKRPVLVSR